MDSFRLSAAGVGSRDEAKRTSGLRPRRGRHLDGRDQEGCAARLRSFVETWGIKYDKRSSAYNGGGAAAPPPAARLGACHKERSAELGAWNCTITPLVILLDTPEDFSRGCTPPRLDRRLVKASDPNLQLESAWIGQSMPLRQLRSTPPFTSS
jgi:hypothetical protein